MEDILIVAPLQSSSNYELKKKLIQMNFLAQLKIPTFLSSS